MTTGLQIITDALSEIGVVGAGNDPEAGDAAFALRKLNQIAQKWANSVLMIPALTEISIETDGSAAYLLGPGGDTATARPLKIVSAYSRVNDYDTPVKVLTREQWNGIAFKTQSGGPVAAVWYEALSTNGRLWTYPQTSGYTLVLTAQCLLTTFTLAGTVTLPDGYESALTLTLAEDCVGAFRAVADKTLRARAAGARAVVKRTNTEPLFLSIEGFGSCVDAAWMFAGAGSATPSPEPTPEPAPSSIITLGLGFSPSRIVTLGLM